MLKENAKNEQPWHYCGRLGPHVISHPPPVRARRSAARGQCGRAELALRHRCLRCRPGGAVARAEGLSWPQIG
jgi:hypothetical protein